MIKWETLQTKRIEMPADVKLMRCLTFTIVWIFSIAIYGKFRGFGWNPLNLKLNYELFGYIGVMAILLFYHMKNTEKDYIFMSYRVELDMSVLKYLDYNRIPASICPRGCWRRGSDITYINGKYFLICIELVPPYEELVARKDMYDYIQKQLKASIKRQKCQHVFL